MRLFVGNLSFDVTDEHLRTAFESFGLVVAASIVRERFSNEPRGFGFVDMPKQDEAQAAIDQLNGKEFMGRTMNVNEARPMPERPSGRGGFHSHRPDSRRRDSGRRRPAGKRGQKPRYGRHPY